MNWQHFTAFVWLRWRLTANEWRRAGTINAVVGTIMAVGALVTAIPLAIACLIGGIYGFRRAEPVHLLYAWDGVTAGFLFCWSIGLMTELQRTEPMSLAKVLHLPVSISGAFLINFVSSLLRLTVIAFAPSVLALCLALVIARGPTLLVSLPLAAAFLLMIGAATYQFQGWLASLMNNPRRRRTVMVAATLGFIVLVQLPNLLSLSGTWGWRHRAAPPAQPTGQSAALERTVRLVNLALPIGWLPLGITAAAEGNVWPGILGAAGMTLIGTASLWRAHRTTLRIYQGEYTAGKGRPAAMPAAPTREGRQGARLLERELPGLSESVSVVALGGLRALLRAPEAKMMLLTPLLLGAVFGTTLTKLPESVPAAVRPLIAIGALLFVQFGLFQIMANQFGFDRDGFRALVLCPAARRDILLGKNLAFAPLALGMAAVLLTIVQVLIPLRLDHFLAMLPQGVSMFLLFALLMNLLSIYTPMRIAPGAMRPANPQLIPILLQLAMMFGIFPISQAPTFLPLAIEALLEWLGWTRGVPVYLVLALVECAAVVVLYRLALNWQGNLFQAREQKILETVTGRAA